MINRKTIKFWKNMTSKIAGFTDCESEYLTVKL